jgi:hypothetical protein
VGFIEERARRVPILREVDVMVVGGGPAGVCAAVGSARSGARTLLVERTGCLGGMWTSGLVLTLGGFNSWLRPYDRIVAGIAGEWLARASKLGGAQNDNGWVQNSDPEIIALVADELIAEAGVECLFHCYGASPLIEGNQVSGAFVECVSGRKTIMAKRIVDCTGDGAIAYRAGANVMKGESLQPMTMAFRLANVHTDPQLNHLEPWLIPIGPEPVELTDEILSKWTYGRRDVVIDRGQMLRDYAESRIPEYGGPWFGGMEKDTVWVNAVRVHGDGSDVLGLSDSTIRGRREAHALANYFRTRFADFANAKLIQTAPMIGVRETIRVMGECVFTGDDIRQARRFEDSIALGGWPIDVHPGPGQTGGHRMFVPKPYEIPYRCLVPKGIDGLLIAGRCISADREALGSTRVGATCAALGHAAGVAAALSIGDNTNARDVDISSLKRELVRQGATVDIESIN